MLNRLFSGNSISVYLHSVWCRVFISEL